MASSDSVLGGGWGWVDGVGLVIVFVLPVWVWWLGLCCRRGCGSKPTAVPDIGCCGCS
uniref:Transmembrane protein n=1 Tax=Fagus sylvatica TaxID=28930 RepID=A0A2N9EDB2_FAGSY